MKPTLFSVLFLALVFTLSAQTGPTPADQRMAGMKKRQNLEERSLVNQIEFRSIGPSVCGGRVADLEVNPEDPTEFYVAYASGGLWKTVNNGLTFEPLFDQEWVMTIGDIAVDWSNERIWVGTGEVNSSRSSYAGVGVFRSDDHGKSWTHLGLGESHHIGRILIHPDNPDILWVAALGHLYTPNAERGLYRTEDGGKTWELTLQVDENTGAAELVLDPTNPDIVYASTWHRERRAWNFVESGDGSGIYKSTDGGKSWTLLTEEGSGFPTGEGVGRIGLDIVRTPDGNVLYAALDNYFRREKEEKEEDILSKEELENMSSEDFLELEKYLVKDYLQRNRFPEEYTVDRINHMIKSGAIKPIDLVEYTRDANSLLFDTPVKGLEVYRSEDGGKSWMRTHEDYLDFVYNSYGYYFGQVRVDPSNPDQIYLLGVPVIQSQDGGKSFSSINGPSVHSDHHALWINPERPGHLILGNDGGINISYDNGENWAKCNTPAVGQFYYVAVDEAKPYRVYGGLQDNGVWMGPSTYEASLRWHASGQYPYKSIMGGDGMQVAIDSRDNQTVYTGFQFGNYARINTQTGDRKWITPRHKLGERPLRWNWQTPIHLSIHNQDILYMGSNKFHRSLNQGDDFEVLSDDLTQGGKKGDVAYGTLTTLHESPLRFGLLYVGSDDGLIHLSRDGGYTWKQISDDLPQDLWVSRVQASSHREGRVYAVLNGYRNDDFTPYLYVSEDYGENWSPLGTDLPMEPLNVVKEDPENEDLLYVGSDHGLYVSLDRGQSFMLLNNGLPAAPVHDVVLQAREKDLIVGTHGRSLYKGSVKELQQLPAALDTSLWVFQPEPVSWSSRWGNPRAIWTDTLFPMLKLPIYTAQAGNAKLSLKAGDDLELKNWNLSLHKGLQYLEYDLSINPEKLDAYQDWVNKDRKEDEKPVRLKVADDGKLYLHKGKYTLTVSHGGEEQEVDLEIK
jgi:hypothetical protein